MLNVASMLRRRTNVTSFVSKSTRPDTDSPPHQNWCREHLQKLATSTASFCIENNLKDPILHISAHYICSSSSGHDLFVRCSGPNKRRSPLLCTETTFSQGAVDKNHRQLPPVADF